MAPSTSQLLLIGTSVVATLGVGYFFLSRSASEDGDEVKPRRKSRKRNQKFLEKGKVLQVLTLITQNLPNGQRDKLLPVHLFRNVQALHNFPDRVAHVVGPVTGLDGFPGPGRDLLPLLRTWGCHGCRKNGSGWWGTRGRWVG